MICSGGREAQMEEHVLICEDSIDGILTGIYEAYQYKKDNGVDSHDRMHLAVKAPEIGRLFTCYTEIQTDAEKARKVSATIKRELGEAVFYDLCLAMTSHDEEKADAVYHTIVIGLRHHDRNVFSRLREPAVQKAFACQRGAGNELNHYRQFLRFAELESGILYAKIGARDRILPFLMPHFADRLPADNFVIYDELSGVFGLHPQYKQWYLASGADFDEEALVFSKAEAEYSALFTRFCESIAIEARTNPKLQMSMLPLRFRKYMVEFEQRPDEKALH
ncbi:MAG: TIGR03915 family putative DNA repair protein [Roseburia sp.]|nr:TIGR03915 family putative DNA repair protein [Roseburia sp.]